jgi:putative flippase GtrA
MKLNYKFTTDHSHFIIFLFVGGITTLVYYVTFYSSFYFLNQQYFKLSVTIAYFTSVIIHYLGNRYLTFKSIEQPIALQLWKYLLLLLINYFITLVVTVISKSYLGISPSLSILMAVVCTIWVSYILSHYWVFKMNEVVNEPN